MNGGRLGVVDEKRDLGVRITSDLKASAHCELEGEQGAGHDQ